MSFKPDEARIEEVKETPRSPKCRIPQRCQPLRPRARDSRIKPSNFEEPLCPVKPKNVDVRLAQQNPRIVTKCATVRPRSTESRPRSNEEKIVTTPHRSSAPDRDRRQIPAMNKFQKTPNKRLETSYTNKNRAANLHQKPQNVIHCGRQDQEVINVYNEPDLRRSCNEILKNDNEEDVHRLNNVNLDWEQKKKLFDQMKTDLESRQKTVMELYATLKKDQRVISQTNTNCDRQLPSTEELKIMNVAKMTPSQLFQLYTGSKRSEVTRHGKNSLNIDVNKFYEMPNNIIAVCDQTLTKRKEIIDWFETLKKEEKGISIHKLSKKINEFNAENEMLKSTLQTVKAELFIELDAIVGYLRKSVNETIAFQLRTEELTYELSELNSTNADLRKQLHAADHMKSPTIRHRVEELERELKEERCKKMVIRDRLSRAEGQVKIGNERAVQLEAALEQARSQNWALERTVQQLHDQNQKLQSEFDKELNKLTESIRMNTVHLEEIAAAREKLQTEKENLEKRLQELSETYNESLEKMQQEANLNSAKLAETEKKFDFEKEETQKLDTKLKGLYTQLLESELRYKEVLNQLQEKDVQYNEAINSKKELEAAAQEEVMNIKQELEAARQDLELANLEVEDYRKRLINQGDTIREIDRNFKETISLEKNLRSELKRKEVYIEELVEKQAILEQQLKDGELKMESYEMQLTSLKGHISELRKEFGEFENMNQLQDMINQQRTKLLEATKQNGELVEVLERKDLELESRLQHITEQEALLEERDGLIKILKDKEDKQNNMIKLLRDNLEMRVQTDTDLSQQVVEKNREIEVLLANLETRKEQISHLEKIILTLEEQIQKINSQRKKDQERINLLDKALNEFEACHIETKRHNNMDIPVNLDNLIKILEDELDSSFESKLKDREVKVVKKQYFQDRNKRDKLDKYERQDGDNSLYQAEHDKMPTKVVMGNFVKKTYVTSSDEQYKGDLDRKKAITNIDAQNWPPHPAEPGLNQYTTSAPNRDVLPPYKGMIPSAQNKDQCLSRNFQFLMSQRDEKKCKMFKLAGHKL